LELFYKKISLINSRISPSQTNTFCKQKYLLHTLQEDLQSRYLILLQEHGLAGKTLLWNNIDDKEEEILLPTLESQLNTVQRSLKSAEVFDDFEVNNISFHELGSETTQALKEKIILIAENTIKKVLADMLEKNILDTQDIKML
jgi:hypothetical protein